MTAFVLPNPKQQYFTTGGVPLIGGRIFTFEVGTSTPKATFADSAEAVPNSNPVILDGRGEAVIYWKGFYRVEVRDILNTLLYTVDNVGSAGDVATALTNQLRTDLANPAAGFGAALVAYAANAAEAVSRTALDKLREGAISIIDLGVLGDGTPADRLRLIAAMNRAVALGKTLYVPDKTTPYDFNNWFPIPSGLRMMWADNAWFRLSVDTGPVGAFLLGGYDKTGATLTLEASNDVVLINPKMDCNNIAGENAINCVLGSKWRVYNPRVRNTKHSTTRLGGRAFQFEGAVVEDIVIWNADVQDCTIGLNYQADPAGGTSRAIVQYLGGTTFRNVDVPMNCDAGYANPQNGVLINSSCFVEAAVCYDCGKLTFAGAASPLGGGIICGDRGFGLTIGKLRVINSPAYGQIGALTRGVMYQVCVQEAEFDASAVSLHNFNVPGFGDPSAAATGPVVIAENTRCTGNLDYLVTASVNGIGASRFNVRYSGTAASLISLLDTNAGASTAALAQFTDYDTGAQTPRQSLKSIFEGGNQIANFREAIAGFRTIKWRRLALDETNTALFSITCPPNSGTSIDYLVTVVYPQSGTSSAVAIQRGLVAIAVDGGGNTTSGVFPEATRTALDNVSTFTITVSLTPTGTPNYDVFFIVNQNNEPDDAACDVYVTANVTYSLGSGVPAAPKAIFY